MGSFKRSLSRSLSEVFFLQSRLQGCRKGFRVLLYHSVGAKLPHDSYGISMSPELFEQHMHLLAEDKSVQKINFFEKSSLLHNALSVAVTFDDGYKDNFYTAAPVLIKYNIPFTVFVVSSFVQKSLPLYLSPSELCELASLNGVTIGSHGATHVPLCGCGEKTLMDELYGSRRAIEDMIGKPVTEVSYPYGSVDRRVRDTAARAGYTAGGCSQFGINDERRDPLLLCRTEMVAADTKRVFYQKLYGAWDWYRWRQKDPVLS